MQTVSGLAKAALHSERITAYNKVIAEWNQNRFAKGVTVTNAGGSFNETVFPLRSIVGNNRPNSGIPYARCNEGKVASQNDHRGRFKVASENGEGSYEYWISPSPSNANRAIANAAPTVLYSRRVRANKVVAKFEQHQGRAGRNNPSMLLWNRPTSVDIQITTENPTQETDWQTVATNLTPNSDGVIEIYLHDNSVWKTSVPEEYRSMRVRGVRAYVNQMLSAGQHCAVIEVSARYVQDLSEDVVSLSIDRTREEQNLNVPLGVMQANEVTIELANVSTTGTLGRFHNENTASDLVGLIDKNVELTVSLGVRTQTKTVFWRQGTFYANEWNAKDAMITVTAADYSKFLQQEFMPPTFMKDVPVGVAFREALERVGFQNIVIQRGNHDNDFAISYVWFNEEETVWSAMTELVKAEGGAFYFDEFNRLRFESRNFIYQDRVVKDDISSVDKPGLRGNLIDMSTSFVVEANRAIVKYSPLKATRRLNGDPVNNILWNAEDTVALMSSTLETDMTATSNTIRLLTTEARTWPNSGMCNIEGEYMSYEGKEVRKFNGQTPTNTYAIRLEDEEYKWEEGWNETGRLMNVKRGIRNSIAVPHTKTLTGWTPTRLNRQGQPIPRTGTRYEQQYGRLRMDQPANTDYNTYLQAIRGSAPDTYKIMATSVYFIPSVGKVNHGIAGFCWNRGLANNLKGYYCELVSVDYATNVRNGTIGNIRLYKSDSAGNKQGLPPYVKPERLPDENDEEYKYRDELARMGVRGYDFPIVPGGTYTIEVFKTTRDWPSPIITYTVYINGQHITSFTDMQYQTGYWGPFVRGNTAAGFEYVMMYNPPSLVDGQNQITIEEQQLYSRMLGGYVSGYAARMRASDTDSSWFFDEFGPHVQESKDFDVDFNISPALSAEVFNSNEEASVVHHHVGTPFGSTFTVDNASRRTAVLNGEDSFTLANETVTHSLAVSGMAVMREEERKEIIEQRDAIRRRGVVEVEIDNPWIQTEDHAREMGAFIASRWGEPLDIINLEVLPNPAWQVGDLVSVEFPQRHMAKDTHLYHIIGVNIRYDGGLTGNLTLRRDRGYNDVYDKRKKTQSVRQGDNLNRWTRYLP